ncbi:MAG TPA: hypothetical protein VG734_12080 [Lacunisphaera sp.]|nr:hypothetical protein [Lacunisphaera sp.]
MSQIDPASWTARWRELGAKGDPAPWHRRLVAAYGEPHRHYHNLQHLEECLAELAAADVAAESRATIGMALWFHDAVYDPRSATNEEDSARLADECLGGAGVAAARVGEISRLILATKTHRADGSADAALLLDIDLAILGQPEKRFWEYEAAIRREYAWVPAVTFAEKRAEILRGFLLRPALYQTAAFRDRYETTARANLKAAIERLIQGGRQG